MKKVSGRKGNASYLWGQRIKEAMLIDETEDRYIYSTERRDSLDRDSVSFDINRLVNTGRVAIKF